MGQAIQEDIIAVYEKFPLKSEFFHPRHIVSDVKWAVIKDIKGQRGRVCGHVIDNVFYIVFFDINHKFWITGKKHT